MTERGLLCVAHGAQTSRCCSSCAVPKPAAGWALVCLSGRSAVGALAHLELSGSCLVRFGRQVWEEWILRHF